MSTTKRSGPLLSQGRVLKALILRDIRTRFFGNGLGYVVAILWPLTHMFILLLIYVYSGRMSPLGGNTTLFLAIAVVPALSFSYTSRFIMMSMVMNKPLMTFPAVRFTDIVIARSILEAAASVCVAALMAGTLIIADIPVSPDDPMEAALAFGATILFGVGMGALNAVIVMKLPGWMLAYILLNIVFYISSGVLFMVSAFPVEIRNILWWNPLVHSLEWMREAYYSDYMSPVLNKEYLVGSGLVLLFVAFFAERVFRSFLMR